MASNDGIMEIAYYDLTAEIVNLCVDIAKILGRIDAVQLRKPQLYLRKENRIKSIQASLQIEGNTLSVEQVSALIDNKLVVGPSKDILEVQNAIKVYEQLASFNPLLEKDYLKAHKILMNGLIANAGTYRSKGVAIVKAGAITHTAPPAFSVPNMLDRLFAYLVNSSDNWLIKSCVFHYEMEFIHPFADGNGRMGRLWQSLLLMKENPIFEFLPIEQAIKQQQQAYYNSLSICDKAGKSTVFIEFMLSCILRSLNATHHQLKPPNNAQARIIYFKEQAILKRFSRKDYMQFFQQISSATATRDLRKGVALGLLQKTGKDNKTIYQFLD